jgi:hypothetical protein
MSRTKRRKGFGYGKGKRNYADWVVCEWFPYGGRTGRRWTEKRLTGKELAEATNHFHSDAGVGDRWPVPAWFRREHERIRRTKMKVETRRILDRVQAGDYDIDDDYYIPVKRDIQWEWW